MEKGQGTRDKGEGRRRGGAELSPAWKRPKAKVIWHPGRVFECSLCVGFEETNKDSAGVLLDVEILVVRAYHRQSCCFWHGFREHVLVLARPERHCCTGILGDLLRPHPAAEQHLFAVDNPSVCFDAADGAVPRDDLGDRSVLHDGGAILPCCSCHDHGGVDGVDLAVIG